MYLGTTAAARKIGVSPNTLRRWLREKLVGEPRVMLKNGNGVVCLREFDEREIEALKRFKTYYQARQRERWRNYRLDPRVKAGRKALRKEIRNAEQQLHLVEWFEKNPHCGRNHRAWEDAYARLDRAGMLDAQHNLVAGIIEGLGAKLAGLKIELHRSGH